MNVLHLNNLDGQKIAKKLSKGITKETSTAKRLLDELNASLSQVNDSFVRISLDEVLSSVSEFWQSPSQASKLIPFSIQRDIIEAYLLLKRCDEELVLLKCEMCNVIDYYNQKKDKICSVLRGPITGDTSQFSRGCISLLKKLQLEVNLHRSRAMTAYADVLYVTEPASQDIVPTTQYISDSSCSEYDS